MSLRSSLNGTFGFAELDRLKFPVAWSGTVPAAEAKAQEAELTDFAREAIEALQAAYDNDEDNDGEVEYALKVVGGEIQEIVVA